VVGLGKIDKLASDMGETRQFDTSSQCLFVFAFTVCCRQNLIARIIVDHEVTLPITQELPGIFPVTAFWVVKDDYPGIGLQVVAAISPLISFLALLGRLRTYRYYDVA
jgi:hypothetical protein